MSEFETKIISKIQDMQTRSELAEQARLQAEEVRVRQLEERRLLERNRVIQEANDREAAVKRFIDSCNLDEKLEVIRATFPQWDFEAVMPQTTWRKNREKKGKSEHDTQFVGGLEQDIGYPFHGIQARISQNTESGHTETWFIAGIYVPQKMDVDSENKLYGKSLFPDGEARLRIGHSLFTTNQITDETLENALLDHIEHPVYLRVINYKPSYSYRD